MGLRPRRGSSRRVDASFAVTVVVRQRGRHLGPQLLIADASRDMTIWNRQIATASQARLGSYWLRMGSVQ
jgi:hypothetical protein